MLLDGGSFRLPLSCNLLKIGLMEREPGWPQMEVTLQFRGYVSVVYSAAA